ncbi:hypothetical protein GT370_18230 [Acidocella sp. MX-AZ03]|uniref:hypothetical protein n=1 Tax=Acidocella sp. MX-AZ03 TaxID=2697363 RepID=UPI0022DDB3FB|nr:hypothetical protein [Acidocella sp. MX-AZ03]WBO58997.1 hypothetical protein GT370_18230 [Acidocella sp. MX-AZ03]
MAEEFLRSPETEPYNPPIGGKLSRERTVKRSDIIGTWTSRLANSIKKNKDLYGCADFVKSLNEMPGEARLFSLSFKNQRKIGTFWFTVETEKPVGFVVVEKDGQT